MKAARRPPCPTVRIPPGFSGWWCQHCDAPRRISEELGSPARCPQCHKATAVWIPPSDSPDLHDPEPAVCSHRPKGARAQALFQHIRNVMEHPDLNPDLREVEHEETIR